MAKDEKSGTGLRQLRNVPKKSLGHKEGRTRFSGKKEDRFVG